MKDLKEKRVIDICVYNKCNNRCLMCTNPISGNWPSIIDNGFEYSLNDLERRIFLLKEKEKKENCQIREIYLSGGEPTISPYFFDFVLLLRDNFPYATIKLLTNGRRFFYSDFTRKFLEIIKKTEIIFSICGPNAKIHDSVTRTPGSFNQFLIGLEKVLFFRKDLQRVCLRFVVSKITKNYIFETLRFITTKFPLIDEIAVIFMEIEGHAIKNFNLLEINYSDQEIQNQLDQSFSFFLRNKKIFLYHFPLCTLKEKFWPFVARTLSSDDVIFLPKCQKCIFKELCLGVPKYYVENNKNYQREIKPIFKNEFLVIKSNKFYFPIEKVK